MDLNDFEKIMDNAFGKASEYIYEMRNMRSESDMKKGALIFLNALRHEIESMKARR